MNLTEEQLEDNEYAASILENEGSGYAVTTYCSGDRFLDPKTSLLWMQQVKLYKN